MKRLAVDSSRAQMKIQQMAFMLVALFIFFSLVALIYFAISFSNLKQTAQNLQDEEAKQTVRKLADSPELAFTSSSDCANCIDFDKALALSEINSFKQLWDLDFLAIEKISSSDEGDCTRFNYPDCARLTIIETNENFGSASWAFIALAHWDPELRRYRYDIGKIYASGENLP